MNHAAYISLLNKETSLRQQLPFGHFWPGAWLPAAGARLPLLASQWSLGANQWWLEAPWLKRRASQMAPQALRSQLSAKVRKAELAYVGLEPLLLQLGGGAAAWAEAFGEAEITLLTGVALRQLAGWSILKKQGYKRLAIWLGEEKLDREFLNWLGNQTELLILGASPARLADLELWQAQARYETGLITKICTQLNKTTAALGQALLVLGQVSSITLSQWQRELADLPWLDLRWQTMAGDWATTVDLSQAGGRQLFLCLPSQPRRLLPVQAEVVLCREEHGLWQDLRQWEQGAEREHRSVWWEEGQLWLERLAQKGLAFGHLGAS